MSARQSIQPTYDRRETGDRYRVITHVGDRLVSTVRTSDPFVTHRVTVGWRDRLFCRRLTVTVQLDADRDMVEDVMELNADYTGLTGSSRNVEWKRSLERALDALVAS